jgi:hypothetical protein
MGSGKYETNPNAENASRSLAKFAASTIDYFIAARRELEPRKKRNEAKFADRNSQGARTFIEERATFEAMPTRANP